MNIEEIIREAISNGEIIDLVYWGGSSPGQSRKIHPIALENGKIKALCVKSGLHKIFLIDKFRPPYDNGPLSKFETLDDVLKRNLSSFEEQGWHIQNNENSLSLHKSFKNGKPMKGFELSLDFEEFVYDLVAGADGELHQQNYRPNIRPWSVRGKSSDTVSYGHLNKAALKFIELAAILAQKN